MSTLCQPESYSFKYLTYPFSREIEIILHIGISNFKKGNKEHSSVIINTIGKCEMRGHSLLFS